MRVIDSYRPIGFVPKEVLMNNKAARWWWWWLLASSLGLWLQPPGYSCQRVGLGWERNTTEVALEEARSPVVLDPTLDILTDPTNTSILQFFTPDEEYPTEYVVRIVWHGLQVWAANANAPVRGPQNCSLRLQQDGNLVLSSLDLNLTEAIVWETGTAAQGVVAMTLLETGNLMLLNATNGTVWQSFDHPSDTLLYGQRLSIGTTLQTPAAPYSLAIDGSGLHLFATYAGQQLPYLQIDPVSVDNSSSFGQSLNVSYAELTSHNIQLFANDSNSTLLGSIPFPLDSSSKASEEPWWYLQLDANGSLSGFIANSSQNWQYSQQVSRPTEFCDLPDACDAYVVCNQSSGNCSACPLVAVTEGTPDYTEETPDCSNSSLPYPSCANGNDITGHRLLNLSGYSYFSTRYSVPIHRTSLEQCASDCIQNCSCMAAFFIQTNSSCFHISEVRTLIYTSDANHLAFIRYQVTAAAQSPALSPGAALGPGPALVQPTPHNNGRAATIIVSVSVSAAIAFALLLSILVVLWIRMRRKRKAATADDEEFLDALPGLPPRFSYKELKAGTRDFSHKLGAGGFGAVYEGFVVLKDKKQISIAVKRLEGAIIGHGRKQFRAEIATIGSIRHVNLVRLCGFCMEGSHRLLVYEFMCNGSLDTYLFRENANVLQWKTRFSIALGTARGLAYLHEECRERIIHFDIKPENILLNENFEPRISDFGLAKLMSREQSYAVTTMRGTRGYLAPEWLRNAPITEKSDVYSYGMVLLELVSGRRMLDLNLGSETCYLPTWASLQAERSCLEELIDPRIARTVEEEEACRVIAIGLWCIQEEPAVRPSMGTVVRMLQGDAQVLPLPIRPSSPPSIAAESESSSSSITAESESSLLHCRDSMGVV